MSFCRNHQPAIELIRANFDPSIVIIDIGAGMGAYRDLLPEYCMDGIEICDEYIDTFKLRERYRNLFHIDAVDFVYSREYQLAILGDVLEHMTIPNARTVLSELKAHQISIVAQIPYRSVQGALRGNNHEVHVQSDLTHEVFMERYGEFGFVLLTSNRWCGIYYSFNN